jgi:hypothetical protein
MGRRAESVASVGQRLPARHQHWVCRRSILDAERACEGALAVGEDSADVRFDDERVHRSCEPVRAEQLIADLVGHECATVTFLECVRVVPRPIRTTLLGIDEAMWRIPLEDLSAPAHRQATQPQSIVDDGPSAEVDRPRRQDAEAEQIRRDPLEIEGVSEEREDRRDGQWKPLARGQRVLVLHSHTPRRYRASSSFPIRRARSTNARAAWERLTSLRVTRRT